MNSGLKSFLQKPEVSQLHNLEWSLQSSSTSLIGFPKVCNQPRMIRRMTLFGAPPQQQKRRKFSHLVGAQASGGFGDHDDVLVLRFPSLKTRVVLSWRRRHLQLREPLLLTARLGRTQYGSQPWEQREKDEPRVRTRTLILQCPPCKRTKLRGLTHLLHLLIKLNQPLNCCVTTSKPTAISRHLKRELD